MFTKPVIYTVIITLLAGIGIGVGIGYFVFESNSSSTGEKQVQPKPKRIIVEKPVYIEKEPEVTGSRNENDNEEEGPVENDTVYVVTDSGVVIADTNDVVVVNYDSVAPEGIIVRKEQMVRSAIVKVNYLTDTGSTYGSTEDSVMMEHLDIKPDYNVKSYEVEIWSSPLNFKGYRLGKKKLLLYGMEFVRGMKLFSIDDVLYLKADETYYKLRRSEDFLPYEKVVDASIKARLK